MEKDWCMPNGVSVAHVGVEFGSDRPWLAQLRLLSSGLPGKAFGGPGRPQEASGSPGVA